MSTRQRDWLKNYNCFFITTTFKDWLPLFINEDYFSIVADSITFCLKKYDVLLIAYVFMPTHIHMVLFFNDKIDPSGFMRDLKKYTSAKIRNLLIADKRLDEIQNIRYKKYGQNYKVWMDRFDCVIIKSKKVLLTKIKYIHENPIRKDLVIKPEEWQYSSAYYYKTDIQKIINVTHAGNIC